MLCLPREIRDQIYGYSLCAAIQVEIGPKRDLPLSVEENPYNVPSPGLLRTNRQIYSEAIEILYAKNIFEFGAPKDLLAFAPQIGPINCQRVRQILLWIMLPAEGTTTADSFLLSEDEKFTPHWVAALALCGLDKVVHLIIEADDLPGTDAPLWLDMPQDLQQLIEGFLRRVAENEVPHLSLRGFREEDREKFPPTWKVVMNQWDPLEDEMDRMQEEECSDDSQWSSFVGGDYELDDDPYDDPLWMPDPDRSEQEEHSDDSQGMSDLENSAEQEEDTDDSP